MFWRFCRTKPFIDSYSTSRDGRSNARPLFLEHPLHSWLLVFGEVREIGSYLPLVRRNLTMMLTKMIHLGTQGWQKIWQWVVGSGSDIL